MASKSQKLRLCRLRARRPEVWVAKINKIEDKAVREKSARLIWWDYFGSRKVHERWAHLDSYLGHIRDEHAVDPEDGLVEAALISCGYPAGIVKARVSWTPCDAYPSYQNRPSRAKANPKPKGLPVGWRAPLHIAHPEDM